MRSAAGIKQLRTESLLAYAASAMVGVLMHGGQASFAMLTESLWKPVKSRSLFKDVKADIAYCFYAAV